MQRIESVKEILPEGAFDESSFPIVHADGDECGSSYPMARKHPAGHYSLEKGVVPKEIKHGDERIAHASVVRLEQDRENQHPKQRHGHFDLVIFEPLDSTQSEIAQQQGEEHVVSTQVESSIMQKAPGDL